MSLSLSTAKSGSSPYLLFALLCLVWGSTWLSLKVGVATVPPLTFAAVRFLAAAVPLLGWAATRGGLRVSAATVAPSAVLMIAANYGLMAWGITRVPSGMASVINLSTVPTATLLLAVAHGQARWSATAVAAVLVGCAGLTLLFAPRLAPAGAAGMLAPAGAAGMLAPAGAAGMLAPAGAAGMLAPVGAARMLAIAAGAAAYAWGGILTKRRPVADPVALAGWQCLAGGALLAAAALLLEPLDRATLSALLASAALANLGFLVIAGSVLGGAVYLMLLARWSAISVAAYAFVCPLIALGEGAALGAECPRPAELGAAALLLLATGLSLAAQTRKPCQTWRS